MSSDTALTDEEFQKIMDGLSLIIPNEKEPIQVNKEQYWKLSKMIQAIKLRLSKWEERAERSLNISSRC